MTPYLPVQLETINRAARALRGVAETPQDVCTDLAVCLIAQRQLMDLRTIADPCPRLGRAAAHIVRARTCFADSEGRPAIAKALAAAAQQLEMIVAHAHCSPVVPFRRKGAAQ